MKFDREVIMPIMFFMLWIIGAVIAALGVGHDSWLIFIPGIAVSGAACGVLVMKYDM